MKNKIYHVLFLIAIAFASCSQDHSQGWAYENGWLDGYTKGISKTSNSPKVWRSQLYNDSLKFFTK